VPDELQQWKEREIALASGQPWEEARVVQVEGRLLEGAEADEAVKSGRAVHSRQCSSPHQQMFHDAHRN
jgi:hypothetical protein